MSLDEATWAEVARLWREGAEPVGEIAARFGVTRQKIVAVARAMRWPARAGQARGPGDDARTRRGPDRGKRNTIGAKETGANAGGTIDGADRRPAKGAGKGTSPEPSLRGTPTSAHRPRRSGKGDPSRRAMVERLYDAMDVKLRRIEQHMAENADASTADSERTTRSLNTLVRSLEKLSAFEHKLGKTGKDRGEKAREEGARDTTERRRHELARRIAKLLERS